MDDNKIGMNIKKYRKGKFTQQELADKIGKTESSIRKYEKGLVTIPLDVLNKIATALEVKVADLMGISDLKEMDIENKAFVKYLNSLGYLVNDISEPVIVRKADIIDQIPEHAKEWHKEQELIEMENCSVELIKDGKKIILTDTEYEQLQKETKDSIEFRLWQKNNR